MVRAEGAAGCRIIGVLDVRSLQDPKPAFCYPGFRSHEDARPPPPWAILSPALRASATQAIRKRPAERCRKDREIGS